MSIARTIDADIAVIGGSLGGVVAVLTALEQGIRVAWASEHAWIGGQFTAQAVPPDEHALIESGGDTRSYRAFRESMRAHYRSQSDFVDMSTMTPGVCNPGDGWVSRLCFEPKVAVDYFESALAPYERDGRLQHVRRASIAGIARNDRRIDSVIVEQANGERTQICAKMFLDATDTGLLLALANHPYRVGKESRAQFGEPDAPEVASAQDQQPVTMVFALRRRSTSSRAVLPIAKPDRYEFWSHYRPPHYSHLLFSEFGPGSGRGQSMQLPFFSNDSQTLDWWRYRRIVSEKQWRTPREEITLVNWAQNDYAEMPLIDGDRDDSRTRENARELSLAFAHWLRHEAPRSDGSAGFGEMELASDVLGTGDGFAQQIYVRESRRMVTVNTLTQPDIAATSQNDSPMTHTQSVGCAWYNMDIHPTCVSGHGVNAKVRPFVLPLGVFVSEALDNLIPACKNIGVTHLVNACTRVHPVEWLVGEVAAMLAQHCIRANGSPLAIQTSAAAVSQLQRELVQRGVPLAWDTDLLRSLRSKQTQHGSYHA
ncbi:MAG: FAD-dependent oxidoreductase [Casimicrobium sp.]